MLRVDDMTVIDIAGLLNSMAPPPQWHCNKSAYMVAKLKDGIELHIGFDPESHELHGVVIQPHAEEYIIMDDAQWDAQTTTFTELTSTPG